MIHSINDINKTIKIVENIKQYPRIKRLNIIFEDDYVIEIKNQKVILYEFEANTEHYYYKGEYTNLINDLKKGYIEYGRKHKFIEMVIFK
ncbi:MAG: hypothetical protein IJJ47_07340 [Methanosphaera sp.]|nr:hypothetical protein [Methanosphaera sp.]